MITVCFRSVRVCLQGGTAESNFWLRWLPQGYQSHAYTNANWHSRQRAYGPLALQDLQNMGIYIKYEVFH